MTLSKSVRFSSGFYPSICFVGICVVVSLSSLASGAGDWPHYLGPNLDFSTGVEKFTATSGTKVWDAKVSTGMCSVTICSGLLYTMGNDGKKGEDAKDSVYCLDAGTGNEKWTFDYQCKLDPRMHPGGPCATPTVHQGKVYTLSKFGQIFCLDAGTGRKIWEASAVHYKPSKPWWGFAGSPTVFGDVVVYNMGDRGLALNKDSGEVIWKSEKSVVGYSTPRPLPAGMFSRPTVALFTNEDFLVLDPATGESVATYTKTWKETSNCNAITPYVHKGRVYLIHKQARHGMPVAQWRQIHTGLAVRGWQIRERVACLQHARDLRRQHLLSNQGRQIGRNRSELRRCRNGQTEILR